MDSQEDSAAGQQSDNDEAREAGIGPRLRAAREAKGVELSHIAAETRIPTRHLQAIETGDFAALPSRTYAIGFAKNYARVVGMDVDATAQDVRAELAEGEAYTTTVAGGMEPGDPAKVPSSGLAWFGTFAAILLLVGGYFFYSTYYGAGSPLASLIEVDEGDSEGEGQDTANSDGEAGGEQTASGPSADGQVVLTLSDEEAWVRFYEEGGEVLFEGVMRAGDTFEVPLDAQDPRLNTGLPNLFDITIDGHSVPRISEELVSVANAPVSAAALLARDQSVDGEGGEDGN